MRQFPGWMCTTAALFSPPSVCVCACRCVPDKGSALFGREPVALLLISFPWHGLAWPAAFTRTHGPALSLATGCPLV